MQIRYSSLEQKLAVGTSVDDHQVVDLTEDCARGADATVGADGTMGSLVSMALVPAGVWVHPVVSHACRVSRAACS